MIITVNASLITPQNSKPSWYAERGHLSLLGFTGLSLKTNLTWTFLCNMHMDK